MSPKTREFYHPETGKFWADRKKKKAPALPQDVLNDIFSPRGKTVSRRMNSPRNVDTRHIAQPLASSAMFQESGPEAFSTTSRAMDFNVGGGVKPSTHKDDVKKRMAEQARIAIKKSNYERFQNISKKAESDYWKSFDNRIANKKRQEKRYFAAVAELERDATKRAGKEFSLTGSTGTKLPHLADSFKISDMGNA